MCTKDFRSTKAITLIALVVSIVVLLILAGVSIVTLTGETGILNQVQNASKLSEIARVEEEANLILTASVIDNRTSAKAIKDVGTILSELKLEGKIENYDTTGNVAVTEIKFDTNSITIGEEDNQTLTATFLPVNTAGGYYVVIKGKKYPVSKVNDKIEIGKTEITTDGSSTRAISDVESDDEDIATVEKVGTDVIKITGVAGGTANITVKYSESITTTISVTVKGYVTVTVQAEKDLSNNDKGTVSITQSSQNNKYLKGSTITLTATPNPTYELTGWYETRNNGTEETNPVSTSATAQYQVPDDGTTTSVVIKAKFEVAASEIAKGINSETYGKYVNYNIDLGIGTANDVTDDWKVFYDDGVNIYIIAADYVPVSNTYLANAVTNMGATTYSVYSIYWSGNTSFQTYKNGNLPSRANGAADIFTNRPAGTAYLEGKGFLSFWKNKIEETKTIADNDNNNAKETACLMDTKIWEEFATGLPEGVTGTAYAIGGPTLSMWVESWNARYPNDKLYYNRASDTGYCVKAGGQPSASNYYIDLSIMSAKEGYNDLLYYPHTTKISDCAGYWLAAPSADGSGQQLVVSQSGYLGYDFVNGGYVYRDGLRPVVCLPSEVQLTAVEGKDNLYDITNKPNSNS